MTIQYSAIPPSRINSERFDLLAWTAVQLENFLVYGYYPIVSNTPSMPFPGVLQMTDDNSLVQGAVYRAVQTPNYPLGLFPTNTQSSAGLGQPTLIPASDPTLTDANGAATLVFVAKGTGTMFVTLLMGDSHRSFQVNVYSSSMSKFFSHTLPASLGLKKKVKAA